MKKFLAAILLFLIFCPLFLMTGCGEEKTLPKPANNKIDLSKARDGTYTAESSLDDKLGKSILTLTIKDKKIVSAEFEGYDLFGNVKDEDYGSLTGKDSADYKKAQIAVKAIKTYPAQLVETQDLRKVDAISGASISYSQFVETATSALNEATK